MKALIAPILAFAALLPPRSPAASYHVDAARGSDAATGEQAAPLRTIEQALSKAQPGDAVVLVPGQAPIHEGILVNNRSGREGAPITIEGGGNTLTGSAPLDPARWEETRPGLHRNLDLAASMRPNMIARFSFIHDGKIRRMGRSSKGGSKAAFKPVEALGPGEWTFVPEEKAFYIATAPGETLAGWEAPFHPNGFATRGSVSHVVVKDLHVRHFLNDGFNFHGHSRHLLVENSSATECGDDGMSAHGDCHVSVRGFTSRGNSTGICHIDASSSDNEAVVLLENVGVNLYLLGSGTHTFRDLRTAAPIRLGKKGDSLRVIFTGEGPARNGMGIAEGVEVEFAPRD